MISPVILAALPDILGRHAELMEWRPFSRHAPHPVERGQFHLSLLVVQQGRLLLAFFGISAFAVIASARSACVSEMFPFSDVCQKASNIVSGQFIHEFSGSCVPLLLSTGLHKPV